MAFKKIEVYSAEAIAELADGTRHALDFFGRDGLLKPEVEGKFFVAKWGDNCTTCSFLDDASVHGPYDTAEEAREIHC